VRPLAAVGLDAFERQMRERVKTAAPAAFRGALPVVDFGGGALAVPHAGVSAGLEGGEALEAVFTCLRPFDRMRAIDAAKKL
jgi:hypothetical protein